MRDDFLEQFEAGFHLPEIDGAEIARFLRACDLAPTWARQLDTHGYIWAVACSPQSAHLRDGFGLQYEVLVLCSSHPEFQARLLDNIPVVKRFLGTAGRLHEHVVFVISPDALLEEKLASLPVDRILVPIKATQILAVRSGSPSTEFRVFLNRYLLSRDFFDKSGPVSGADFFGRERLIADLVAQLTRGSNIGFYGLRKVGKTSILQALVDRGPELVPGLLFSRIDLLSVTPANQNRVYLLYMIASAVAAELKRRGVMPPPGLFRECPPFSNLGATADFERKFDEDFRALLALLRADGKRRSDARRDRTPLPDRGPPGRIRRL